MLRSSVRRTRRIATVVAIGAVCATLTACGEDDTGNASGPTVTLTVPSTSLNFSQEVAEGFEAGAGTVDGVSVAIGGPPLTDGQAQLKAFQDLMAKSKAGASVFTTAPNLFVKPLSDAADQGVPLVAVDNPPLPGSQVGLYIGNDNLELGRMLADEVVAELPAGTESGTIVIGTTSPGAYVLDQRVAGLKAELRRQLPGVTVKGPYDTGRTPEENRATWEKLVTATPDALAFFGTGDADAMSLAGLHEELRATWAAGAFDLEPAALLAVRRGDLVVVSPEHYLKGVIAGRLLAQRAKNGMPLPQGWIRTPGRLVTRANVDEVIARQSNPPAKQQVFAAEADRLLANPVLEQLPAL